MNGAKKWSTIWASGNCRQENGHFGSPIFFLSQEGNVNMRKDSPFGSFCGQEVSSQEEVTILSLERTFFLSFRGWIRGFLNLVRGTSSWL
jgi:hypothetical protein